MNNQTIQSFPRALLADMAAFIRRPLAYQGDETAISAGQRILRAMRVWAILFTLLLPFLCALVLVVMGLSAIGQRMMSSGAMPSTDPSNPFGGLENQNALVDLLANGNMLLVAFLAVIQAPILEEIAFRMWLKPTRRALSIGLGGFLYFMGVFALNLLGRERSSQTSSVSIQAAALNLLGTIVVIAVLAFVLSLIFTGGRLARVQSFYAKHFRVPYVLSSVIFGGIHITNYTNPLLWLAAPVLVFPQLLLGFGLGYVRTRFGMAASIFMHMLHNGLLIIPSLLSLQMAKAAGANNATVSTLVGGFFSVYCGLILLGVLFNAVWSIAELSRPKTQLAQ